jgi:hypothetical protein
MNMSDFASTSSWQMLGELILLGDSSPNELISAWLTELLAPLDLHEKFMDRVLNSIQNYTGRALSPKAGIPCGHIHLSIFGPNKRTSSGQTWGFFRIEKIDSAEPSMAHPDHAVEFYLYQESL